MDDLRMKTFYGKHPMKYMGETQPDAPIGQKGVFAKLKDTQFRKTTDGGWFAPGKSFDKNTNRNKSVNLERFNSFANDQNLL